MKVSNQFKEIIKSYLTHKAETDILFKPVFQKSNKNIEDCITYVLNEVKKTGINAFADEEIFNMCIHYYDEDSIVVGKSNIKTFTEVTSSSELEENEEEDIQEEMDSTMTLTDKRKLNRIIEDDDEDKSIFD